MIKRRTVLVLGAGASHAYGFPVGGVLRNRLIDNSNASEMESRTRALEVSVAEYVAFRDAFRDSGLSSIDSFLSEQAGKRNDLYELGKKAIAFYIGRCEDPQLMRDRYSERDDWYQLRWNALASDAKSLADLPMERIQIVTFNYDRSLEFFFFKAARAAFALEDEEALAFVSGLQIRHVYGSLGKLALAHSDEGRPYQPLVDPRTIERAARQIKLMERGAEDPERNTLKTWFQVADQVCFLGFGFDSLNIERLGFAEAMGSRFTRENGQVKGEGLHVFATIQGITPARVEQIRLELLKLPNPGVAWEGSPSDIAEIFPVWNCLH